ncbi:oxygenase MpaB family protein [Kitasatospora sp. NPDC085464]|uniref:oxygenase MpaB family protein n=1 Tax=Kitasatospora sp. NPDC085464 TaxID=3364063 RepID=UPI0037C8E4EC
MNGKPSGPAVVPAAGLFTPDSVSWTVHADPSMVLGGLRALLLQALHPLAMAAVAQHSAFREDPWGRLYRTAHFVGAVTYGNGGEVREAVQRVRLIHEHVRGTDPETGRSYRADDPELLTWVHCAEVGSFLTVARRSGLALGEAEADRYLAEQARVAHLVGVPQDFPVPTGVRDLDAYMVSVRPLPRVTPAAREAMRFAVLPPLHGRARLAGPLRPAWAALVGCAVGLLPPWARRMYGLPVCPATEPLVTAQARLLRQAALRLPRSWREGPHLAAARRRHDPDLWTPPGENVPGPVRTSKTRTSKARENVQGP